MSVREEGPFGMHFDKTITLGHLLIVLTIIIGGIGAYTTMRVQLSDHELRIEALEKRDERMNDLVRWVYEIKGDLGVIKSRLDRNEQVPPGSRSK